MELELQISSSDHLAPATFLFPISQFMLYDVDIITITKHPHILGLAYSGYFITSTLLRVYATSLDSSRILRRWVARCTMPDREFACRNTYRA